MSFLIFFIYFLFNLNPFKQPVKVKQKTYGTGIGKYINRAAKRAETSITEPDADTDPTVSKKKKKKRGLSDFSEW